MKFINKKGKFRRKERLNTDTLEGFNELDETIEKVGESERKLPVTVKELDNTPYYRSREPLYGRYYGSVYSSGGTYGTYTYTAKTAEKELSAEDEALVKFVMSSHCSVYKSYADCLADENRKDDAYFPAKSGWMVMKRRLIDGNEVTFVDKVKEFILAEDIEPSIKVNIVNKMPASLLQEVIGSFNRIYKASKNEAAAQIYRKREGDREYYVYYPEQIISGAHVDYSGDTKMNELREHSDLIMELHSHNSMGAFWSGGDNSNEKDCGFYMVIGNYGKGTLAYKCRAKYDDVYTDLKACDVFDMTEDEEKELFTAANITDGNPEIDSKVKVRSYTSITYGSPSVGRGYWDTPETGYPYSGYTEYSSRQLNFRRTSVGSDERVITDNIPRGDILHGVINFLFSNAKSSITMAEFHHEAAAYVKRSIRGMEFGDVDTPWLSYMRRLVDKEIEHKYLNNFELMTWIGGLRDKEREYITSVLGVSVETLPSVVLGFDKLACSTERKFTLLYFLFVLLRVGEARSDMDENTELTFPTITEVIGQNSLQFMLYRIAFWVHNLYEEMVNRYRREG